jgi:hypothetical protein
MRVKFLRDIEVEFHDVRGDRFQYFVYNPETERLLNPQQAAPQEMPLDQGADIVSVPVRTFKRAVRDEYTGIIRFVEESFAVSQETWKKLGFVRDYIDSVEQYVKQADEAKDRWRNKWWWCSKELEETRSELSLVESATFWQRLRYLLTGKLSN